jgi:hypothetical protein
MIRSYGESPDSDRALEIIDARLTGSGRMESGLEKAGDQQVRLLVYE